MSNIDNQNILKVKIKKIKKINNCDVELNNKKYSVCCVKYKEEYKLFIIDYDKKEDVINKSWHFMNEGKYISNTCYYNNVSKQLYLHNFVMDKLTFEGKGQQRTVDHINRHGLDNRIENLRFVESQSDQNYNQQLRDRTIELPEDSGLTAKDMPKNVWYGKPMDKHGEFFCFELKGLSFIDGGKIIKKSSKSTKISLKDKLQQIKLIIENLKKEYPDLQHILLSDDSDINRSKLHKEYNDIIKLSSFDKQIIEDNIITFTSEIIQNIEYERENIQKQVSLKESGKKTNNLPLECGITMDMIPKYCYYKPESEKRGCKFLIERHPTLVKNNLRQVSTTESKTVSIMDKFNCLLEIVDKLNKLSNDKDVLDEININEIVNEIKKNYK